MFFYKYICIHLICSLFSLDSNELWNHLSTSDKNGTAFLSTLTDDSSLSIVSDENTNININSKNLTNAAKRNPNVLHSILSQQRPIAPKNGSPTPIKSTEKKKQKFPSNEKIYLVTPVSSPSIIPIVNSSPGTDHSFFSPTNHSMQPYRKNFQCRMCRLTYKVRSNQMKIYIYQILFFFIYRIFMIVQHIYVKNMK